MDGERISDKNTGNRHHKERVRAQIEAQVQEFLRGGGRIDVVSTPSKVEYSAIGDVWHNLLDFPLPDK